MRLMPVSMLIAATLAACAPAPEPGGPGASDTGAPAFPGVGDEDLAPPPYLLTLAADGALQAGGTVTLTVSGATPGVNVRARLSLTGARRNGGTCPPVLGGLCYDLLPSTTALGNAPVDAAGNATLTVTLPDTLLPGDPFWIQVAQPNGSFSRISRAFAGVAQIDADGDGVSPTDGDCDDADPAVSPAAPELCNGFDDNCDGVIDGDDAWWDPAWPYRVEVAVSNGSAYAIDSGPVAVDVDFPQLFADLGVPGAALDPASVRVVRQDCAASLPEIPSEFLDGFSGVFDDVDPIDPLGDGLGAVVFLADRDGDYATREAAASGSTTRYAIYFAAASDGPFAAPAYPSTLTASAAAGGGALGNSRSSATFDAAIGGMLRSLAPAGRPSVANMGSTAFQGVNLAQSGVAGGGWVSPTSGTGAATRVVTAGPVFAAVESTGAASNAFGGYTYTYTWFQFDGRPELYAKVRLAFDRPSNVLQNPFWGAGVRPFFTDNTAIINASNGDQGGASIPNYEWAYGTYDTNASAYGLMAGFRESVLSRSRPLYDATGTGTAGRYVGLVGQDLAVFSNTPAYAGAAGQAVVDHAIVELYPHSGLIGSVSQDFYGSLVGLTPTLGAPEAR